eukprot:1256048-Prymnesium_polylepis.1
MGASTHAPRQPRGGGEGETATGVMDPPTRENGAPWLRLHRCEGITVSRPCGGPRGGPVACPYPKASRSICWGVHQASLTLPECRGSGQHDPRGMKLKIGSQ